MTIPPYPLAWPETLPRTERKASSAFRTSLAAFGHDTSKPVSEIAVTSNVAGIAFEAPKDTAVAVWFNWDGAMRCIAVDRYPKVEDNLQAIHHILEARRTEMRHGGLHIVRQTFKGFVALPAPEGRRQWREVLNLTGTYVSRDDVEIMYKRLAKIRHPDSGGSQEAMIELNAARAEALQALS